jgi:hypothetical protein
MSWTKNRLVEWIGNRRIKLLARIFELLPKDSKRPNLSLGWERVFKLGSRVCVISSGALVVGTVVRCLGTGAER